MINLLLHYHWVVVQFEKDLGWDDAVVVLWWRSFVYWPFICWINWFEYRNTNGFTFEFTMLAIFESDLIHSFIFRPEITVDDTFGTSFHWPKHDSCCKVDRITEAWKLLSTSWCSNYPREDVSCSYTNIAPGVVNCLELPTHVECCQDSSCWIIVMCQWTQTPDADESTSFIIQDQFVHTSFESVNFLLDLFHNCLDFVDSLLCSGRVKINPQRSKHDCQSSCLRAIWLITNFKIWHDCWWHTALERLLYSCHSINLDRWLEQNSISSASYSLDYFSNSIEFMSGFFVLDLFSVVKLSFNVFESCIRYDNLTTACAFSFGCKSISVGSSNSKKLRTIENTTYVQ